MAKRRRAEDADHDPFGGLSDYLDDEELDEYDDGDEDDDDLEDDDIDGEDADDDEGDEGEDSSDDDDGGQYQEFLNKLTREIEEQKNEHPLYKGLQRVIAKKDKHIDEQGELLEEAAERLEQSDLELALVQDHLGFLESVFLEVLPADVRSEVEQKRNAHQLKVLQNGVPRRQRQDTGASQNAQLKRRVKQFVDSRREAAEAAGVDPDDPGLDYGDDSEGLIERLQAFEQSLAKVKASASKDEDDAATRRRKVTRKPKAAKTRQQGARPPRGGGSSLERGANDLLSRIRKQRAGGR